MVSGKQRDQVIAKTQNSIGACLHNTQRYKVQIKGTLSISGKAGVPFSTPLRSSGYPYIH